MGGWERKKRNYSRVARPLSFCPVPHFIYFNVFDKGAKQRDHLACFDITWSHQVVSFPLCLAQPGLTSKYFPFFVLKRNTQSCQFDDELLYWKIHPTPHHTGQIDEKTCKGSIWPSPCEEKGAPLSNRQQSTWKTISFSSITVLVQHGLLGGKVTNHLEQVSVAG